ncbi:hypothetical protein FRB95_004943 [Tulasnella sp. JGI-2019a]|nr:hypothetical protein FRB95_004943 [Tulasnella sp. JGI-2019a]
MENLSRVIIYCRPAPGDETVDSLRTPARGDKNREELLARDIGSWEERLSRDPLVEVGALQVELLAYAMQLLLCLGSPSMDADLLWYTPEDIAIFVDVVVKAQAELITDADIINALRAIKIVISR